MPSKQWDEEESDSSTPPSSPPAGAVRGRRQFGDEEDDSDVLDSWDAAEDSEVEREKAKKATEAAAAKAKADAEAAANKKSRAQRIQERAAENARLRAELDESEDDDETEADKRARLRRTEQDADLAHAEDLFGGIGISSSRKSHIPGSAVALNNSDPNNTVNLADLPLFNPQTKNQFEQLRNVLTPIIASSSKKAHYGLFLQEFTKQLAKELPSDQIKKIGSALTTMSNEKMKEEKAAKGGKKTKAAKTKTSVVMNRPATNDLDNYEENAYQDDGLDFM
jgi:translation initiation factor 3 subunit J